MQSLDRLKGGNPWMYSIVKFSHNRITFMLKSFILSLYSILK